MHQRPDPACAGNTAELSFGDILVVGEDSAPLRGPRSVLCVVVVTTSACGNGLDGTPPATKPREMRHVDHEEGADLVGDVAEATEIDNARIGPSRR